MHDKEETLSHASGTRSQVKSVHDTVNQGFIGVPLCQQKPLHGVVSSYEKFKG